LLALSRAESPDWAPRLEPVDVGATARTVVDELRDRAAEHGVRLSVEIEAPEGPRAQADATSLEHVLTNLVDNAIRHTRPGTHVRVRARTDAGAVLVEVADDGPGIPERHLPRIFERFYRVDPGRSRQVGGTGLGLSIVRHLVQRMGGSVSVDSQIGTGTTFTIRLRAADEGERPSA
ncbi:MAG: ATP-binding protein, partial [Abditibacteriales bacterium]|nr:ATP-binding protein [Abditibacteriales bacterium]